mmetsp:Transcript_28385/g.77917  ORF Transcript_28385/g.77917 Transcript_28385/m.77917 type:complete len:207 (-) Transcript_28385:5139-5759(-)
MFVARGHCHLFEQFRLVILDSLCSVDHLFTHWMAARRYCCNCCNIHSFTNHSSQSPKHHGNGLSDSHDAGEYLDRCTQCLVRSKCPTHLEYLTAQSMERVCGCRRIRDVGNCPGSVGQWCRGGCLEPLFGRQLGHARIGCPQYVHGPSGTVEILSLSGWTGGRRGRGPMGIFVRRVESGACWFARSKFDQVQFLYVASRCVTQHGV